MVVSTVDQFCALLEKSKLLDTDRWAQARELAAQSGDATAAAKTLARKGLISRWQAAQLLLGRSTFTLGKYRLIQMLGRGGMGSVCLAEHVTMNRRVALKIVSRKVSKDPASLERFFAEARAAAALDHPNIVQAYNVDNEADRYYLVMEYVEGMDLQRLVEVEGRLDCERAVDYIRQAADGLEHAHQRNMVHCDIKPSNLLINPQGVVKILDMGLARLTDDDNSAGGEQDERILGSVDYLAPEQALGSPKLDGRADIYALGCTFYFLLTGHPPFPQGTLHEKIIKHQTQPPASIRAERPEVPGELAAFCAKMMAKEPADRYQTAGEVSRQLAEWRPAAAKLLRAVPLPRAEPVDDTASEAIFDAEFEKEAKRSFPDLLPGGPPASLDAQLATLTSSNPNLATLDTNLVLGSRSQPSSKQGLLGLSATWRRALVAASAGLTAVVVAVIMGVVIVGQNGSDEPAAAGQPAIETSGTVQGHSSLAVAPAGPKNDKHVKEPLQKTVVQQPSRPLSPPGQPPPKRGKRKAPKPSPPPQKAPPAGPSKPVEPFKDLAAAAPLPSLPADDKQLTAPSQPVSLGKLRLAADAKPQVSLIGENVFLRQVGRYAVRPEPGSGAARAWVIQVKVGSDPSASHSDPDLARIWLDHSELKMGWLPGAKRSWTDPLQTCGLLVSVGNQSRMVALCRPQEVEPLSIKIEYDPTSRQMSYLADTRRLPCQFLPPESLRLEVTGLARPFPPFTLDPARPIAPTEKVNIRLDNPQLPPTVLQVEFEVQSHIANFTITPLCALPGLTKPSATKEAKTPSASADGPKDAPELTPFQRDQFSDLVDKLPRRFLSRASHARGKERERLQSQLQSQLGQCKALHDLLHALRKENPDRENQARAVYFRLFRQIGDRQVDLLVAGPPKSAAKSKPPGKKQ